MASTKTVSDTIVYVTTLLKGQLLNVNNQLPGLEMANIIKQRILGPPFSWRQNRATLNFGISQAGGTDYTLSVPQMGRIEVQWMTDGSGKKLELGGAMALAANSTVAQPTKMALQYDDNAGNLTFRFNTVPDENYTAWCDYQQKAVLIQSYADLWGPIPDEFAYLFDEGMLALGGRLVNDARFTIWEANFIAGLLATQDGLDEQAKAIFVADWMAVARYMNRSQAAGQMGTQGRGR